MSIVGAATPVSWPRAEVGTRPWPTYSVHTDGPEIALLVGVGVEFQEAADAQL